MTGPSTTGVDDQHTTNGDGLSQRLETTRIHRARNRFARDNPHLREEILAGKHDGSQQLGDILVALKSEDYPND